MPRPALLLILLVSLLVPLNGLAESNKVPTTQLDLNEQAKKKYEAADKELNKVYQEVLKRHSGDEEFLIKFKASQRAWLAFRDAEMEAIFPDQKNPRAAYGSVFPMCWSVEMTNLTVVRTKRLRQWLDAEEGDVCRGSR